MASHTFNGLGPRVDHRVTAMNMFHTFQLPVGVKVVLGGEKSMGHWKLSLAGGREFLVIHNRHNVSRILVASGQH